MKKHFVPALLPLLIASASQLALADTQPARLEEVIVTAEKKAENLQNVPSAIAAFTADRLAQGGIKDLQDLSGISPGLEVQSSGGGESTTIRMRGLGAQRFDQSVAAFVGVFVDEITQTRPGVAMAAMMDTERVEVLRGPQNVLYGKNVPAGAISIVTKKPILDSFSGDGSVGFGTNDSSEDRLNVNIPLIPGMLAARVSGLYEHRLGDTKIEPANQTWGASNEQGGKIHLLFQPIDSLEITGGFSTFRNKSADFQQPQTVNYVANNVLEYLGFVPPAAGEIVPGIIPANNLSHLNDPTAAGTVLGLGTVGIEKIDAFKGYGYRDQKYNAKTSLNSSDLQVTYTLNENDEFTYLGGYQEYSTGGFIDGDSTDVTYSWVNSHLDTKYFSHEVRWTHNGDNFETMLGAFYDRESHRSFTTLYLAPYAILANVPIIVADDTFRNLDSKSVFARLSYDLTDDWKAVIGARYSKNGVGVRLPQIGNLTRDTDFHALVGEGTISYQIDPDSMAYFKLATGSQSGGINMAVISNPALAATGAKDTFGQSKSKYAELGYKSTLFDNRVQLNADVYYQIYNDYQALVAIDSINTYIANTGKVVVQGAETEIAWQMTDHFRADTSLALTDAKYKDFKNAPCSELQRDNALFSGDVTNSCVTHNSQDLSGKRVNEAPLLSISSGLTYTQHIDAIEADLSARGELSYRSDFISETYDDPEQRQGGYTLFNANLALTWANGVAVSLWGKNLTDKEYCTYRPTNGASSTEWIGTSCLVGQRRQYGLTLSYKMD